jgi:hypothetical protein
VVGATVAFACTRAHYPSLDFGKIGRGAPHDIDGEVELLGPHYEVVDGTVRSIVALVENEMETLLERRNSPM